MHLDDSFANSKFLLNLFKNIHPNTISISGIIANLYIIKNLYHGKKNMANILLAYRYLADIMDGAIARHYNKTSVMGGYLDTLDDTMLISLYFGYITWNFTKNFKFSLLVGFIGFISNIIYLSSYNSLHDHSNVKNLNKTLFQKFCKFSINNTILYFIAIILFNIYFL